MSYPPQGSGGSSGEVFVELSGSDNTTHAAQGGTDGAWVVWDLGGIVPSKTVSVLVNIHKLGASDQCGARKSGSSADRKIYITKDGSASLITEVGSNRKIEIEADDTSDGDVFSIVGYRSK
ncbi:hypothetical protein ES704_01621 [subsurface metagenome]